MANPAGSLRITFNGEIFNYRELREELVDKGRRFATESDTEVILQLYEEKGERCVDELNGQWAFAIWDLRKRELFLSRDRLGIRPLYYTYTQNQIIFGSEIKSLFCHPGVSRELDLKGLDEIFTFWCSVAPRTAFKGIRALPPGHSMRVRHGRVDVWSYWQMDYPGAREDRSEEASIEELHDLLVDATRLRLRSDVPVGAYLSGGLDSATVVAMIQQFSDTQLETFSVAFEDPEFDESHYQREVIDYLGTAHREVRCSHQDIGRVFPDVVWHAESPVIRTAAAPLYLLSELVRESGYKVVLTGEGADEVLGGYDIFKEAKIRRFWAARPESKLRPLLLKRLYPYMKNLQAQPDAYLKAFFRVRPKDLSSPFFSHLTRWDLTAGIKRYYSSAVKAELEDFDVYADLRGTLPDGYNDWEPFEQAQYLESTILMPGYILSSQGDRMSMGHSVEGRFPFLDHRVVEFAATLSPQLKMKVLDEKYALKRAMGHLIPPSVARRPKQPYRAPDAVSLLGGPNGAGRPEYTDALLSSDRIQTDGIFEPRAVEKLVKKFTTGRAIGVRDNMALVGIVSTQLLVDQLIENFRS